MNTEPNSIEEDFLGSLNALLVRYDVSLMYVSSTKLAIVSRDEPADSDKTIYIEIAEMHDYFKAKGES